MGLERQLEVQAPAFYSELGLELGVLKPVAWADLVERPLVPGFDWPIHEGLGWDGAGGQSSILLVSLLGTCSSASACPWHAKVSAAATVVATMVSSPPERRRLWLLLPPLPSTSEG